MTNGPDIEELERRGLAAGLTVEEFTAKWEDDEGRIIREHGGWRLWAGAGEFSGAAHLRQEEDVDFALSTRFEEFRPLEGHEAMWSASTGYIEAELVLREEEGVLRGSHPLAALARRLGIASPEDLRDLHVPIPTVEGGPTISLGYGSPELHIWRTTSPAAHLISDRLLPVLRLDGLQVEDGADARDQLEAWGHAALLEIDRSTRIPMRLRTHYPFQILLPLLTSKPKTPLAPVTRAPEATPARLYFHARQMDSGNPSARFLGYYQVLEYYFPGYSVQAEVDRLRGDLGLSGVADDVLAEVVRHAHRGRGIGREVEQFEQVLAAITPGDQLRSIIQEDPQLVAFYAQPTMPIVGRRIDLGDSQANLPRVVAKRLYEIRCRIVHTKEERESEVFVPSAAEAAELYADTRLLGELARRVLVAAGRDLQ